MPNSTGTFYRHGIPTVLQRQTIVTAERTADVVYQNTTGKTILVFSCWDLGGKASTLSFFSDGANPPGTEVARIAGNQPQSSIQQLVCVVLAGHYYQCRVQAGTPTLINWIEYD
jgi:hypothetical protein